MLEIATSWFHSQMADFYFTRVKTYSNYDKCYNSGGKVGETMLHILQICPDNYSDVLFFMGHEQLIFWMALVLYILVLYMLKGIA